MTEIINLCYEFGKTLQRNVFIPEGPVAQIMTETGYHQTEFVSLRGRVRPVLHQVVHHLPRQVHHAHAVLPPSVLGSREDVMGVSILFEAAESE